MYKISNAEIASPNSACESAITKQEDKYKCLIAGNVIQYVKARIMIT